jgi:hypothetical protein
MTGCWLAPFSDRPCDGDRGVKAHLIPKSPLRTEVVARRHKELGRRWPASARERLELHAILWDPRVWVWACGGPTGIGGHHGAFDFGSIVVPEAAWPAPLREYLNELGLTWMLERYLRREAA